LDRDPVHCLDHIAEPFAFPARSDKEQGEIVGFESQFGACFLAFPGLESIHHDPIADEMHAVGGEVEVGADFTAYHLGIDDDPSGACRVKGHAFEAAHVAVKGGDSDEGALPPWGELASSFEPDLMNSVASPINVLAEGAIEANNTVKPPGLSCFSQRFFHALGKGQWTSGPGGGDGHRMMGDTTRRLVPSFREQMQFMTAFGEGGNEALNIELRPSHEGELASDKGELHVAKEWRCVLIPRKPFSLWVSVTAVAVVWQ
jgi:hypothetical protein